jgi:hypothetical protein
MPIEYGIASVEPDGCVTLLIGWFCEESLPVFEEFLRRWVRNVKAIEIGCTPVISGEKAGSESGEFVRVSEKVVRFEDGSTEKVGSFEISKRPVSFRQYEEFVEATKYVTTNERLGEYDTFRKNGVIPLVGDPSRASSAVTCVSYHDAVAYCKWAKVRLPTEAEWLAAYILDWTEYGPEDAEEAEDRETARPEALERPCPEWTAEYDAGSDQAVVRYGPHYVLEQGWTEMEGRERHPADYTELVLQFRVCKP